MGIPNGIFSKHYWDWRLKNNYIPTRVKLSSLKALQAEIQRQHDFKNWLVALSLFQIHTSLCYCTLKTNPVKNSTSFSCWQQMMYLAKVTFRYFGHCVSQRKSYLYYNVKLNTGRLEKMSVKVIIICLACKFGYRTERSNLRSHCHRRVESNSPARGTHSSTLPRTDWCSSELT